MQMSSPSILKLPPSDRRVTDEYKQVQTGNRRLQTGNRRLQTSYRRVTDDYRRVTDDYRRVNFLNTTDNMVHASSCGYGIFGYLVIRLVIRRMY